MTPFKLYCTALFGEDFSASQVGDALGVTRDTIRQWLKRETMPAAVSIAVLKRRLELAAELSEGVYERLDAEDQQLVDEIVEAEIVPLRGMQISDQISKQKGFDNY